MTAETIHTCSYSCERPECIRAQRDELASRLAAARGDVRGLVAKWRAEAASMESMHRKQTGYEVDWSFRAKEEALDYCADELEAALAAEGVQAGEVECDCPGKGKDDPALHAPNCPARLSQQPEARGVVDGWKLIIHTSERDNEPGVWAEKDGSRIWIAALTEARNVR